MSNSSHVVAYLLFLSVALLAALMPGGPLETRSFSQMPLAEIVAYNAILTALGLYSVVTMYFVVKMRRWAFFSGVFCGAFYIAVYALDLWGVFPATPDPMPPMLFAVEAVGIIAAMLLILYSVKAAAREYPLDGEIFAYTSSENRNIPLLIAAIFMGVGIILFTTYSAMQP